MKRIPNGRSTKEFRVEAAKQIGRRTFSSRSRAQVIIAAFYTKHMGKSL